MNRFRRGSLLMLVLLLGAAIAVACTTEDATLTPVETPGSQSGPTPDIEALIDSVVRQTLETLPDATSVPAPDVEAIVETVVRETLATMPSATPGPTPDIDAMVETVVRRTLEALSTTIFPTETGNGPATPTIGRVTIEPTPSAVAPEPTPVPQPQVEPVQVRATRTGAGACRLAFQGFRRLQRAALRTTAQRGPWSHSHGQWLGESSRGRGLCGRDS